MSDPTTKRDILDRLKVYEEYGPLSSVAIHPETPGYSTGMLLGDTRAARREIKRLRDMLRRAMKHGLNGNRMYHVIKAGDLGDEVAAYLKEVR